jgi:hypothetical protein
VTIALGLDGRKVLTLLVLILRHNLTVVSQVVERTEQMCKAIRKDGKTTKGRLAQFVRPVIDEILPEDAHTKLNSYPGGILTYSADPTT